MRSAVSKHFRFTEQCEKRFAAPCAAYLQRGVQSRLRPIQEPKFQAYKRLASLREYVLVSQDARRIEVYRLEEGGWRCETGSEGASVTIHGCAIAVDAVYG